MQHNQYAQYIHPCVCTTYEYALHFLQVAGQDPTASGCPPADKETTKPENSPVSTTKCICFNMHSASLCMYNNYCYELHFVQVAGQDPTASGCPQVDKKTEKSENTPVSATQSVCTVHPCVCTTYHRCRKMIKDSGAPLCSSITVIGFVIIMHAQGK